MKLDHQTLLFVHVIFIPCDNRLGVIFQGEDSSIYIHMLSKDMVHLTVCLNEIPTFKNMVMGILFLFLLN